MSITITTEGNVHTIKPDGQFNFSVQKEFRSAYEEADKSMSFIVDFLRTDYMDSAALGMLLLMREYAGGDSAKITLANCNNEIKSILEVSNFQKLFKLT